MVDETGKDSTPVRDSVPDAPATRSPDLDATRLLSEMTPQSDSQIGSLSKLEDLSKFPETRLLGGPDKDLMKEAQKFQNSFGTAMRYMTKSA